MKPKSEQTLRKVIREEIIRALNEAAIVTECKKCHKKSCICNEAKKVVKGRK